MDKQATSKDSQELNENRSKYHPFLLVMLILSSVMTTFLFFGAIGTVVQMSSSQGSTYYSAQSGLSIERNVFYWLSSSISMLIAFGSIAALALLWLKKNAGIILKFSLLGLTAFNSLLVLGVEQSVIAGGNFLGTSPSEAEYINSTLLYSSSALPVIFVSISIIFLAGIATLWYFAWSAQQKHDGAVGFLGK